MQRSHFTRVTPSDRPLSFTTVKMRVFGESLPILKAKRLLLLIFGHTFARRNYNINRKTKQYNALQNRVPHTIASLLEGRLRKWGLSFELSWCSITAATQGFPRMGKIVTKKSIGSKTGENLAVFRKHTFEQEEKVPTTLFVIAPTDVLKSSELILTLFLVFKMLRLVTPTFYLATCIDTWRKHVWFSRFGANSILKKVSNIFMLCLLQAVWFSAKNPRLSKKSRTKLLTP